LNHRSAAGVKKSDSGHQRLAKPEVRLESEYGVFVGFAVKSECVFC